jgi:nitrite reductase (NADH) small subunit
MTVIDIDFWVDVCAVDELHPDRGVAAIVGPWQVALWRLSGSDELYALENWDPFCKAFVLSRGIVGCKQGTPKVASPMYKQNFALDTGICLENPDVSVASFPVREVDGRVMIGCPLP